MEADDYMPLEARMNSRHGEAAEGYAFLAFRCYTKEGVYLHVEGTFQNGTVPGFGKVWMLNLVNKERSMAVSDLDPVTGLLNMHAFYQRVEKKIDAQRAKRQPDDTGMLYCPVYLNLTNFKVYNETHGLYEGDRMLRKIGQILKSKFPSSYITRLSGDNFALFVPRQGLEIKIRDLCQAVNNEIHLPNITMKAGIGSFDEEAARAVGPSRRISTRRSSPATASRRMRRALPPSTMTPCAGAWPTASSSSTTSTGPSSRATSRSTTSRSSAR